MRNGPSGITVNQAREAAWGLENEAIFMMMIMDM